MKKLGIKELPKEDRPYEKFEKYGAKYLTDAELLAVILKSGSKELNSVELAKYILGIHSNGFAGFDYLKEVSKAELMKIPGIGKVKAIELKCLMELTYRIYAKAKHEEKVKITCPKDVYNLMDNEYKNRKTEEVRVIILDNKNYVKSIITVCIGTVNMAHVSPKEVLSEPIKQLATSIILVHNHPSSDTLPSRQDILLTKKICDYSQLFDINLSDHIIIGKDGYTSLREINTGLFLGGSLT